MQTAPADVRIVILFRTVLLPSIQNLVTLSADIAVYALKEAYIFITIDAINLSAAVGPTGPQLYGVRRSGRTNKILTGRPVHP